MPYLDPAGCPDTEHDIHTFNGKDMHIWGWVKVQKPKKKLALVPLSWVTGADGFDLPQPSLSSAHVMRGSTNDVMYPWSSR